MREEKKWVPIVVLEFNVVIRDLIEQSFGVSWLELVVQFALIGVMKRFLNSSCIGKCCR